jgi:hypothetical protein
MPILTPKLYVRNAGLCEHSLAVIAVCPEDALVAMEAKLNELITEDWDRENNRPYATGTPYTVRYNKIKPESIRVLEQNEVFAVYNS